MCLTGIGDCPTIHHSTCWEWLVLPWHKACTRKPAQMVHRLALFITSHIERQPSLWSQVSSGWITITLDKWPQSLLKLPMPPFPHQLKKIIMVLIRCGVKWVNASKELGRAWYLVSTIWILVKKKHFLISFRSLSANSEMWCRCPALWKPNFLMSHPWSLHNSLRDAWIVAVFQSKEMEEYSKPKKC